MSITRLLLSAILGVIIPAGLLMAEQSPLEPGKKFSHAIHTVEAELECIDCHVGIDSAGSSTHLAPPGKEICAKCHGGVENPSDFGVTWGGSGYHAPKLKSTQEIIYSHKTHIANKVACSSCHSHLDREWSGGLSDRPTMAACLNCHDGRKVSNSCALCHGTKVTLADIHPGDWRHEHGDPATTKREWCLSCHQKQTSCLDCHRGDNLTRTTHPLNYQLTHGLDARAASANCQSCHENQEFCNKCHQSMGTEPIDHLTPTWRTLDHGKAARSDIQNCASCHDVLTGADLTCARSGCHYDADGVKGTDPAIHGRNGLVNSHGPWHDDPGYFCFDCHPRGAAQAGTAFCGYCHGDRNGH